MKKTAIYLTVLCAILLGFSCNKGAGIIPGNSTANAQLIAGKYTADVVEGSFDNTTWTSYLLANTRNVVTINADRTYSSSTLTLSTGAVGDILTGTWSLSADGNTLNFQWGAGTSQPFTIVSLTANTMVATFSGHNIHTPYSSTYYPYNRVTYTRQ